MAFDCRCLASVFQTSTLPNRVHHEIQSKIEGAEELVSVNDTNLAALPLTPGMFKQVFPGIGCAELFARHLEAQRFLLGRGVRIEMPPIDRLKTRIQSVLEAERRMILGNPFKLAAIMIWRAGRKSTPYLGSLEQQRGIEKTLREIC